MSNPMTRQGEKMLREELSRLKDSRVELSKTIGAAIKLGDLTENADYHYAKEKQGLVEARIRDIESKLSNAQVIDISRVQASERVVFGCTVTYRDLDSDKVSTFKIVGEDEANASNGMISIVSPLARAMIGHSVDDEVELETPDGLRFYIIQKVEYV